MHITAAIWVNDEEDGLKQDFQQWLDALAPARPDYLHHRTGEDNADAHLKRTLVHHQVILPRSHGGRLDLGAVGSRSSTPSSDGRRKKRVVVKVRSASGGSTTGPALLRRHARPRPRTPRQLAMPRHRWRCCGAERIVGSRPTHDDRLALCASGGARANAVMFGHAGRAYVTSSTACALASASPRARHGRAQARC